MGTPKFIDVNYSLAVPSSNPSHSFVVVQILPFSIRSHSLMLG